MPGTRPTRRQKSRINAPDGAWLIDMAKTPGVRTRQRGRPSGMLQAHVDLEVRERAKALATAAGVSMAAFLEYAILSAEVDDDGRPTCVPVFPDPADEGFAAVDDQLREGGMRLPTAS